MKLTLICLGAIFLGLLIGFVVGAILPGPIDTILSVVLGWLYGYYIISPIIIEELGL